MRERAAHCLCTAADTECNLLRSTIQKTVQSVDHTWPQATKRGAARHILVETVNAIAADL